jgi:hypothetical protein
MPTLPRPLFLGGLAFVLGGCAMPYYAAAPAPVYYPLGQSSGYYPAQRAGIAHQEPGAIASKKHEEVLNSKLRRTRHPAGETLAARRSEKQVSPVNDSGWINPEP